jgi:hypothetical protein
MAFTSGTVLTVDQIASRSGAAVLAVDDADEGAHTALPFNTRFEFDQQGAGDPDTALRLYGIDVKDTEREFVHLRPGTYVVTFAESLTLSSDQLGVIQPTSAAANSGIVLSAPFLDAGTYDSLDAAIHVGEDTLIEADAPLARLAIGTIDG